MRNTLNPVAITLALAVASSAVAAPYKPKLPDIKPVQKVYKTVGDVKLALHVFNPPDLKDGQKRPAIIFFFGGGWRSGTPRQFYPHCQYLASRGMVAMAAEYRVKSRHGVDPDKCVTDAKSAMRWARQHAKQLNIDPNRLASGGGSAGGHLGAAVGVIKGFDEKGEDTDISASPNAMVLFDPALDISERGFPGRGESIIARFAGNHQKLSPQEHVRKDLPPTIIFHGKGDKTVPYAQATRFAESMKKAGNRCEVVGEDGAGHGYFNYGRGDGLSFVRTVRAMDKFLASLGFLKGEPTLELPKQQ